MTLGTVIQRAWEELGEPSDLDPKTVGVQKFRDAANEAQDVIAMWIDDRGRKVFFREFEDSVDFETVVLTGTLEAQGSQSTIVMPVSVEATLGRYAGWVLAAGGEARRVALSTVVGGRATLTVNGPFTVDLTDAAFTLSKVEYRFEGDGDVIETEKRVVEIRKVYDLVDGVMLDEVAASEQLMDVDVGVPGSWKHRGSGVAFDVAPTETRRYRLFVVRLPTKLVDQSSLIEVPEAFAQALVMRVVWWGYRRMQDFQAAYATKREFQELMTRLATASWLNGEPDYFTVRSR